MVTWSVQEYSLFLHSPVLLGGHIGLNKMKHRNRLGISMLYSLLTVQFNVPQKCYEPNTEPLKTCKCYELNFSMLFLMKLLFEFFLIFCCQKFG